MPAMDRYEPGIGRYLTEKERAPEVTDESNHHSGGDKQYSPSTVHPVKFAKEKRDHEGRLKRADARAGIVDSHLTGRQLDHVAVLNGEGAEQVENLDGDRGIGSHERLHDQLLELRWPGDGGEK